MSEKIYTCLFRLYPSSFRKEYQGEALRLIRDRLRDETGFFKRARLWWDLVTDILTELPSAYRNSYAVAETASLSLNTAGIPSFKILDKEPLGIGSILAGSTISMLVLAAFAFLLSWPIAYHSISGSNGRMSPIESVMQRLNHAAAPDSAASSLQDTATAASAQMTETRPQPSTPGASPLEATSIGEKQTGFGANRQEFANGPTALVWGRRHDSHPVAEHGPIPPGQLPEHAARAPIRLFQTQDIADTWQGTLHAGKDLRTVIKIFRADGGYKAAFYSIDQSGSPVPVTEITLEGATLKYGITAFDLTYKGKLSADGKRIVGISNQGKTSLPLTFTRSTPETAWAIPAPRPVVPR